MWCSPADLSYNIGCNTLHRRLQAVARVMLIACMVLFRLIDIVILLQSDACSERIVPHLKPSTNWTIICDCPVWALTSTGINKLIITSSWIQEPQLVKQEWSVTFRPILLSLPTFLVLYFILFPSLGDDTKFSQWIIYNVSLIFTSVSWIRCAFCLVVDGMYCNSASISRMHLYVAS